MEFYDVRMWFVKQGDLKYISHLDLQRFMQRTLKRSGLPLWHTEGFNPHPYVTFALPLSLGQESLCEMVDFRLTKSMSVHAIKSAMERVMPYDMRVLAVAQPIAKAKMIAYADYTVCFHGWTDQLDRVTAFLCQPNISVVKRTKKGGESVVNLAEVMQEVSVTAQNDKLQIYLRLPAGSTVNVNPSLLVQALEQALGQSPYGAAITRTAVRTADGNIFS